MQRHSPRVRMRAVLPQINSLPRSEREFAGVDGNGKIHGGQRGADVRGHVVIALGGVAEKRIAIAHEPRKKRVKVAAHIGVGVFLDEQRGGGVPQMQREQAVAEFIFGNPFLHGGSEFNQSAIARRDDKFVKLLAHD